MMPLVDSTKAGPADDVDSDVGLRRRFTQLTERLREAEETLDAIRAGEVDAVVVSGDGSASGPLPRVYTLETADQPYRLLIEEIQEGALTLGADGVILYCNHALAAMLRTPLERVIGARLRDFLLHGAQQEAVARLLAHGRGRIDFVLLAGGGAAVPAHLSLSELSVGDGSHGGRVLCGVLVDLTEREARARELADAYARLERETAERQRAEAELHQTRKMDALGQLASGVAHDFNNAAAVVLAGLALLEKRHGAALACLGPDVVLLLAGMKQAGERGGSVAHRLLAFARHEDLCATTIDPAALLGSMQEVLAHSLGPGVRVRVEQAAGPLALSADRQRLETNLINLAVNARDAMAEGGVVVLGAAAETVPAPGGAPCPASLAPGAYVRLWVTDSGVGMDAATLARATDPFFTTKPKDRGTGLGLSMAVGFAAQSGGALAIESQPGRGTTVSLWLPSAPVG
jgi:signal transduction histidine kinase